MAVCVCTARLYDTREKELIESFVDDVMELVELEPNKDALVRLVATTTCTDHASWPGSCWHSK